MEIAPDDIKESLKSAGRHVSMDAPLQQDEEGTLYDVLLSKESPSPDKGLLTESLRKEIERALSTLTYREANIIRLYFGLNGKHQHTLEEIGEEFNLTRERVRQIKEKAIKRLKNATRCRILKTYLG
jgi:RNA polymerase primary sigma factor